MLMKPRPLCSSRTAARCLLSRRWVPSRARHFLTLFVATACATHNALADEDGVGFWIPGSFGSMAATQQEPGWSVTLLYYYARVSASGSAALAREITLGRFNPLVNINVNANVHTVSNQGYVTPSYVFATPFFGGQVSASLQM